MSILILPEIGYAGQRSIEQHPQQRACGGADGRLPANATTSCHRGCLGLRLTYRTRAGKRLTTRGTRATPSPCSTNPRRKGTSFTTIEGRARCPRRRGYDPRSPESSSRGGNRRNSRRAVPRRRLAPRGETVDVAQTSTIGELAIAPPSRRAAWFSPCDQTQIERTRANSLHHLGAEPCRTRRPTLGYSLRNRARTTGRSTRVGNAGALPIESVPRSSRSVSTTTSRASRSAARARRAAGRSARPAGVRVRRFGHARTGRRRALAQGCGLPSRDPTARCAHGVQRG